MKPESELPDEEVLVVHRRPRRSALIVLAALVLVAIAVVVVRETGKPAAAPSRPVPTSVAGTSTPRSTSPTQQQSKFGVTVLGHPLLPVDGNPELFGRAPGLLVRIQLGRGRVTKTAVPGLASSGPVSFVLGADEAIIRPIDLVPGYVVPDGRAARELSGPLGQGGPVFPGPDPDHVWADVETSGPPSLRLLGLYESRLGPVLPLPRGSSIVGAVPDGAGYVLVDGAGGTYDSGPAGVRRITTGDLLAVGPDQWLVRECVRQRSCTPVVIDQSSGARHELRTPVGNGDVTPGVIAPDGAAAAFILQSPSPALTYVDLRTGAQYVLPLRIGSSFDPHQSLAWSPDSRWLFALDATGGLNAVDARTRRITDFRDLGATLPALSQIAIR